MEGLIPSDTFVLILGASTFPDHPQLIEKKSFFASADGFRQYVLASDGLAVPAENLLWLFDSELGNREQLLRIDGFIQQANARKAGRHRTGSRSGIDLIALYVGHGAYWHREEYYLTPKTVVQDREQVTSIRFADFAHVINRFAGRRYVILDCCYAAAAAQHLQSIGAPATLAQESERLFPKSGTALLAASSKDSPAEAPEGAAYTLFSDALLKAVSGAATPQDIRAHSIRTLYDSVSEYIQYEYAASGVQPELHVPRQTAGDISTRPIFRIRTHEPDEAQRMEAIVAQLKSELEQLSAAVSHGVATPQSNRRDQLWMSVITGLIVLAASLIALYFASEMLLLRTTQPIIAVQTDYGTKSYYMGALAGRIYKSNPRARVQLLTAEINSFDRIEAAWSLWQASRFYPAGTIFLSIVNPGGLQTATPRVIKTKNGFYFVGPDNGIFDFVVQHYGHEISYTIASKDITPVDFKDGGLDYFGPTAAALATGFKPKELGPSTTTYSPKLPGIYHRVGEQEIVGSIMLIDSFGNVITNITESDVEKISLRIGQTIQLQLGDKSISLPYHRTYSVVQEGTPVAIINDGSLQFAVNMGNFAKQYGAARYQRLSVKLSEH